LALATVGCGRSGELLSGASTAGPDLGSSDGGRGLDLAVPRDGGRPFDMGRMRDGGRPGDMRGADMSGATDLSVPLDLATPPDAKPLDLATPPDLAGPCVRNDQCPANEACDWLTGQCVPIVSCNRDRDCSIGEACVDHQCLPLYICFPGSAPCPTGEQCRFPPGVCVPSPDCGPGRGCPSGERCVAGYCEPDSCTVDGDCNDGYACVKGQCQPQRYCDPFDPCPRFFRCETHICVPR
jgi:hypothetical protein